MSTCAEKQAWLAAAESALHSVQIGGKVKVLRMGEKSIEYSVSNVVDLVKYVRLLQDQVNACTGDTTTLRRRAFGVIPQG